MGSIGFSHDPPSPAQQNQSIHSHLVTHVGKEAANLMWFLRNVHGNENHFLGDLKTFNIPRKNLRYGKSLEPGFCCPQIHSKTLVIRRSHSS